MMPRKQQPPYEHVAMFPLVSGQFIAVDRTLSNVKALEALEWQRHFESFHVKKQRTELKALSAASQRVRRKTTTRGGATQPPAHPGLSHARGEKINTARWRFRAPRADI